MDHILRSDREGMCGGFLKFWKSEGGSCICMDSGEVQGRTVPAPKPAFGIGFGWAILACAPCSREALLLVF